MDNVQNYIIFYMYFIKDLFRKKKIKTIPNNMFTHKPKRINNSRRVIIENEKCNKTLIPVVIIISMCVNNLKKKIKTTGKNKISHKNLINIIDFCQTDAKLSTCNNSECQ